MHLGVQKTYQAEVKLAGVADDTSGGIQYSLKPASDGGRWSRRKDAVEGNKVEVMHYLHLKKINAQALKRTLLFFRKHSVSLL